MAPSETYRGRGGGRGARGGARGGRGGSGAGRGRGGFKVGPSHAPSDAYLGKAKKIKQDLIDRARIKKSFAKTLKKEGLTSERLGSSTNATALGARANPYGQPKDSDMENDRSDGRRRNAHVGKTNDDEDDLLLGSDESMHSGDNESMDSEEDEEDDFEEDKTLTEHRRRMKGKGRDDGHEESSNVTTRDRSQDDRPQRWKQVTSNRFASGSNGSTLSARGSLNARSQDPLRREPVRGPSRPQQQPVVPPTKVTREDAEALRELKRQAYLGPRSSLSADVHPSRTRKQQQQQEKIDHRDTAPASSPAVMPKPGKNGNAKNAPVARPAATGKAPARAPTSASAAGKRRDGRPNLNARMGLLLEQIQRSK